MCIFVLFFSRFLPTAVLTAPGQTGKLEIVVAALIVGALSVRGPLTHRRGHSEHLVYASSLDTERDQSLVDLLLRLY